MKLIFLLLVMSLLVFGAVACEQAKDPNPITKPDPDPKPDPETNGLDEIIATIGPGGVVSGKLSYAFEGAEKLELCLELCQQNNFKRESLWAHTFLISIFCASCNKQKALDAARTALDWAKTLDAPDDFRLFLDHLLSLVEGIDLNLAVSLFASAETLVEKLNVIRPAFEQKRLDGFKARVIQALGVKEFGKYYELGKTLDKPKTVNAIENLLQNS